MLATAVEIRDLRPGDWPEVARIYAEGIETGEATFETAVPSWPDWDRAHCRRPRLVAAIDGGLVAWAAIAPVSARPVYRGVAEISLYVAERARHRGIGTALLAEFVRGTEQAGIWTLQTSVFPENEASLRLLAGAGFRCVGRRERIGKQHRRWRDTVLLERRSEVIA
ncbi:MAG TPA: GNAT family N-acetyltransferase [Gaiellaceae bacterium]